MDTEVSTLGKHHMPIVLVMCGETVKSQLGWSCTTHVALDAVLTQTICNLSPSQSTHSLGLVQLSGLRPTVRMVTYMKGGI